MRKDDRATEILFRLLFMVAMLGASTLVSSMPLDVSRASKAPVELAAYFEILEDPTRTLTIADVQRSDLAAQFKANPTPDKALNFGVTNSAYWLRLKLENPSAQQLEQMLEIANARLAFVDFYRFASGLPDVVVNTGYFRPFADRAYSHRFFVFPVVMAAQSEQTLYFRLEAPSIEVPATLWSRDAYPSHHVRDQMLQATYFGMVAAMVLFNLLLWGSLRDRSYALYIVFVLGNALSQAALTGIGIQYFWGDLPHWSMISYAVGAHFTAVFLVVFFRHMVDTAHVLPRFDKVLKAVVVVNALMGVIASFFYRPQLSLMLIALTTVVILVVALQGSIKGLRPARIFLLAFFALLITGLIAVLRQIGMLPSNAYTASPVQIGSAIQMILLAYSLADRFHVIRAEKEKAQSETLRAERRVIETLRESERVLEARVDERTNELSATVTRLQQTQRELVEAEKLASLGALVAGVAHELNTPIGNALTAATTLEVDATRFHSNLVDGQIRRSVLTQFADQCKGIAELIVRSCQKAATLVSSFKQVAVDQTSEHRRSFDLLAVVEDNVVSLRPSLRAATWAIEVEVPAGITADSYPGPLGQILTNLIQNAAVHAFEGRASGLLRLSASVTAGTVRMVISDNGEGMSASTLAHIFEPFYTTKLGKGGSGLGLAICRNMATGILGGQLTATSEQGVGSNFVLTFPVVAPITPRAATSTMSALATQPRM